MNPVLIIFQIIGLGLGWSIGGTGEATNALLAMILVNVLYLAAYR
jgi:hypothetical protein